MSQDFDISAEVAAAVGDRAGVWQFIRDFAGLWRSPLTNGGCQFRLSVVDGTASGPLVRRSRCHPAH